MLGGRKLPKEAARLLERHRGAVRVSAASVWEIAIKHALNRRGAGSMDVGGAQALEQFRRAGFELLDVTPEHAAAVDGLSPHHGDPFDRLIVAQAEVEGLRLVTSDEALAAYGSFVVVV